MEAYSGFAGVYDRLMDDFDYPAWADFYLEMLAKAGVRPKRMCDCACGTGGLTLPFARRGIEMTGVDIAREMLEHAARKARQSGVQISFVCQDMCRLKLPRPVDAIVCGCDGVNYLIGDGRVRAFFRAAHEQLRPGGALAFDISSAYKLRQVLGDGFFGEEREDVAYLWQNTLEGDVLTMDMTFFIREPGGLYRRVSEVHRQYAHEAQHLDGLLRECGFEKVEIWGDRRLKAPEPEEMRIHFCAIRA